MGQHYLCIDLHLRRTYLGLKDAGEKVVNNRRLEQSKSSIIFRYIGQDDIGNSGCFNQDDG